MRSELIIFILVMVANGAIALWKQRKEAQAAAEERLKASGGMRAPDRPRAMPRPAAPRVPATSPQRPARRRQEAPPARPAIVRAPVPAPARPVAPPVPVMGVPRSTPAAVIASRRTVFASTDPRALLRDRAALRRAFLLREILGPPRGDEPPA